MNLNNSDDFYLINLKYLKFKIKKNKRIFLKLKKYLKSLKKYIFKEFF